MERANWWRNNYERKEDGGKICEGEEDDLWMVV